jgi:hypothetical protein
MKKEWTYSNWTSLDRLAVLATLGLVALALAFTF